MKPKIKVDYKINSGIYSEFNSINVPAHLEVSEIFDKVRNKHKDLKSIWFLELLDVETINFKS